MKRLKVILTLLVTGIIVFLLGKWSTTLAPQLKEPREEINVYTLKLDGDLKKFKRKQNIFKYNQEEALSFYYRLLFFSKKEVLDQRKTRNTSKYIKYNKAFIALYTDRTKQLIEKTLNKYEWNEIELVPIEEEIQFIKEHSSILKGVENQMTTYQDDIDLYREASKFYERASRYQYTNYSLYASFPLYIANSFIQDAKSYLDETRFPSFTKNCTVLRGNLSQIERVMVDEQLRYIYAKMDQQLGSYRNSKYYSLNDYTNYLIGELIDEFNIILSNIFENTSYTVVDLQSDIDKISSKIRSDEDNAAFYFKYIKL